jgi:trans-feruloyl-CoA hydratase/vanillin synthase
MAIARKIASKDVHALRATKEGYRYSLEMTWDAAMNLAMAKELELVQRQNDAWRKEGIQDFLQGKYKPGLEAHPG